MADQKSVFIAELLGFANPVIARRLQAAGARVIAADPGIASDGEHDGVETIGVGAARRSLSPRRQSGSAAGSMQLCLRLRCRRRGSMWTS